MSDENDQRGSCNPIISIIGGVTGMVVAMPLGAKVGAVLGGAAGSVVAGPVGAGAGVGAGAAVGAAVGQFFAGWLGWETGRRDPGGAALSGLNAASDAIDNSAKK